MMGFLAFHINMVKQKIRQAAERSGRGSEAIKLVAVTKTVIDERIKEAVEQGVTLLGENRVQEAEGKMSRLPGLKAEWHLIGHLQSNKVKLAATLFTWIQSVDSLRLAELLEKEAGKLNKKITGLLEVNIGGEANKFGAKPKEAAGILKAASGFQRLSLQGLMTVAPQAADQEGARPYFREMTLLKKELEQKLGSSLPYLSMGMSGDYETAIEEGANIVRVGRAIFGER